MRLSWKALPLVLCFVAGGACRRHHARSTRSVVEAPAPPSASASVVPAPLFAALSAVAHDRATPADEALVRDSFAWDLDAAMTAIGAVQGNAGPAAIELVLETTRNEINAGQSPTKNEMKALAERVAFSMQPGEVCGANDASGDDLAELKKAADLPPLPAAASAADRAFYAPFATRAKSLDDFSVIVCDRAIPQVGFARDSQTKRWVLLRRNLSPSRRPR